MKIGDTTIKKKSMREQLEEMSIEQRMKLIADPQKLKEIGAKLDEEDTILDETLGMAMNEAYQRIQKKKAATSDERIISTLTQNQKRSMEQEFIMACGKFDQTHLRTAIGEDPTDFLTNFVNHLGARHLVGVQPMDTPCAMVYSLEYKYPENKKQKLSLELVSRAIEARTSRTSARWSQNLPFDSHELELQQALKHSLSSKLAAEYTGWIINDLRRLATHKETFDFNATNAIAVSGPNGDTKVLENEHIKALGCSIRRTASQIARTTRRGAGNWIIVSTEMAHKLEEEAGSMFELHDENKLQFGTLMQYGTLNGTIKVFTYIYAPEDEILVGYKGKHGESDAGYIVAPFIPALSSGVAIDPTTFEAYNTLNTRYGVMPHPKARDYYGIVKLKNVPWAVEESVEELPNNDVGTEVPNDHLRHEENVDKLVEQALTLVLHELGITLDDARYNDAMKLLED